MKILLKTKNHNGFIRKTKQQQKYHLKGSHYKDLKFSTKITKNNNSFIFHKNKKEHDSFIPFK